MSVTNTFSQEEVALLSSPCTGKRLQLNSGTTGEILKTSDNSEQFQFRNNIPVMFTGELGESNRRYQTMYDRMAKGYDLAERIGCFFMGLGGGRMRRAYTEGVEVQPGGRILEVSIGTGGNVPYVSSDSEYWGLDISFGMLSQCKKRALKSGRRVHLVQGAAEHLPFQDASFDLVWHVGGINFFDDRKSAIKEMIRAAKPGSKIIIIDETEKAVQNLYEKIPFVRRFFRNRTVEVKIPAELVPTEMIDLSTDLLLDDRCYRLSFRTPQ